MTDFQGSSLSSPAAPLESERQPRVCCRPVVAWPSWSEARRARPMACWPSAATSRIPQRSTPQLPRSSSGWMALMSPSHSRSVDRLLSATTRLVGVG
jgi:hypothetical protein